MDWPEYHPVTLEMIDKGFRVKIAAAIVGEVCDDFVRVLLAKVNQQRSFENRPFYCGGTTLLGQEEVKET